MPRRGRGRRKGSDAAEHESQSLAFGGTKNKKHYHMIEGLLLQVPES